MPDILAKVVIGVLGVAAFMFILAVLEGYMKERKEEQDKKRKKEEEKRRREENEA